MALCKPLQPLVTSPTMSLRRIALRDFVIVQSLDLDLSSGFSVLTGETGAGKSILIDALQLALGSRADAGVVREGAQRCEVAAEFDSPAALAPWLEEQGFTADEALLLRRTVDTEGRSRAWINGSAATATQLRAVADHLVDIHGQHAWQGLTRADAVRELLDAYAGTDLAPVRHAWQAWRQHRKALDTAREQQASLQQNAERLQWQIAELDKLSPGPDEWTDLNTQHGRLANAQSLIDATALAVQVLDEDDGSASTLISRAVSALQGLVAVEPRFASPLESLEAALAQVQDSVHELHQLQRHTDLDPARLAVLDERLGQWVSLARRYRRPPEELAALHAQWKTELAGLDAALDMASLQAAERAAWKALETAARKVSQTREKAAPRLSEAVTATMQTLGMQGGRFEVGLIRQDEPQVHGWEAVEFRVAGHAGATPRPASASTNTPITPATIPIHASSGSRSPARRPGGPPASSWRCQAWVRAALASSVLAAPTRSFTEPGPLPSMSAIFSILLVSSLPSSLSPICLPACLPTASKTVTMSADWPRCSPGTIVPP